MDCSIANDSKASAFGLIDLAIRESYFEFLFDRLISALVENSDEFELEVSQIELPTQNESVQFRNLIFEKIQHTILDDEDDNFLNAYFNSLADSEHDLIRELSPNLLRCEVQSIIDSVNLCSKGVPKIPTCRTTEIYRACPYLPYKAYSKQSVLLTPFYYLAHLPFWPPDDSKKISPLVMSHIKHGPKSINDIATYLSRFQLYIRLPFLRFFLSNEERVLFVDKSKNHITLIENVIKNFDVYSKQIDRKKYSTWYLTYFLNQDNSEITTEVSNVKVNELEVEQLLNTRITRSFSHSIDWTEVGAKLLISHDHPEEKIQGLPSSLHKAISQVLLERGSALNRADLENALGFKIDLEPDLLGPGRIMAYARHPRFLNPDEAFYVLKDWVESDTEKKGRIAKERIATPFEYKDTSFSRWLLNAAINADELYQHCGIVDAEKISKDIAFQLASKPTEPYYLKVIKERVINILEMEMIHLGMIYYMKKDLCIERHPDEANDRWRWRVIAEILDAQHDIKEKISRIENAFIRSALLRMIN